MSQKKTAKYFSYSELVGNPTIPFSDNFIPGGPLVINLEILEVVKKDFLKFIKNLDTEKAV